MPERLVPRVVKETFTPSYAFGYETLSAKHPRAYETAAKVLSKLDGGIQNGDTVVEISCGTGNSAIILLESNPNLGRLIGFDPSIGFLRLAAYKFGKRNQLTIPEGVEIDQQTQNYIEEQRQKGAKFKNQVDFVLARGDGFHLPVSSKPSAEKVYIDKIYIASGLHWMAFADDDPNRGHKEYLRYAIGQFSQILKPGGKLFFDSSGHQFDFENERVNGIPINSYHYLGHPFRHAFINQFALVLEKRGIASNLDSVSGRPPYNRYFTLGFFKQMLESSGFKIIPAENGKPYQLTMIDQGEEGVLSQIRDAGKMQYFKTPQLKDLPESVKQEIIDEALSFTLSQGKDLLKLSSQELFASFAAVKL